ncbi:MAG: NAD(P)-dependent oxidoreductase [Bacteroidetes bacterium]|nr:NAD(P)-dependent oxidoreductase [Bacteroidota bacterium]
MGNVIIIGSSGFLGSAVTSELLSCGFQVFATKNKRPIPGETGLTVIEGGIKALTTGILDQVRPEAIFHCARPVIPGLRRWGRIIAAFQAKRYNRFLLSQIDACQVKPVLIFASGSLVYGNSSTPHSEAAPLNPVSYARQYHRGEAPVLKALHEKATKVVMVRFPWLLGNGSWFSWFYLKPLREQMRVPLFGEGSNYMSLISLTDAARMMVKSYRLCTGSCICNVSSPIVLTQKSFAAAVAGHYGGTVTDHKNLYPGGLEKEALEAFASNILMQSGHPELQGDQPFQNLEQMLDGIKIGD